MTARDDYIARMKTQLDELNAKMDRAEAKAKEAKADARIAYQEEMTKLRHQSSLAAAKFDQVKAATEESWDGMVTDMEKLRDAFVHSFRYFRSQM